ncbi:MAG: hypothetical protein ABL908_15095 [Hyphomicrobium sp.]
MPLAAAQTVRLDRNGDVVPDLGEARKSTQQNLSRSRSRARGYERDVSGGLFEALPDSKREGLKLPVIVLSDRASRSRSSQRDEQSDRRQSSAVRALETLVRDESGKWYNIEYAGIDPTLSIHQDCFLESAQIPERMRDPVAASENRQSRSRTRDGGFVTVNPASFETPASITLLFVAFGTPCLLEVVCSKPDDSRCRERTFIEEFAARERQDIVHAPKD